MQPCLYHYAASRADGTAIAASVLHGESLTTVKRRRPAKLVTALDHAPKQVQANKGSLEEYKRWTAELTAARDAVSALDSNVRKTCTERRQMTPEVQAARAAVLKAYGAAKLVVEGVPRQHDRTAMMSEVFDDLAETHRVPGVTDEQPSAPAGGSAAATP